MLVTARDNLFHGAVLVVAALFVLGGGWRAGLIVAASIPLAVLFAGNLMAQAGIAGSLMSLGAIDFGILVDSSVIMVENSVRHLSEPSAIGAARKTSSARPASKSARRRCSAS